MDWLDTSMVPVLVNRSPSKEFKLQRRLRQCDPLALFLFIVVMEGLSGMMREAISRNMYSSYKVGK